MKYFSVLIALVISVFPITCLSEVRTPEVKLKFSAINPNCKPKNNSERSLAECAAQESINADIYLKKLESDIVSYFENNAEKEKANAFKNLSLQWVKFVEQSCIFDSASAGGFGASFISNNCTFSYTNSRIVVLEKYYYFITHDYQAPKDLYMVISPEKYQ